MGGMDTKPDPTKLTINKIFGKTMTDLEQEYNWNDLEMVAEQSEGQQPPPDPPPSADVMVVTNSFGSNVGEPPSPYQWAENELKDGWEDLTAPEQQHNGAYKRIEEQGMNMDICILTAQPPYTTETADQPEDGVDTFSWQGSQDFPDTIPYEVVEDIPGIDDAAVPIPKQAPLTEEQFEQRIGEALDKTEHPTHMKRDLLQLLKKHRNVVSIDGTPMGRVEGLPIEVDTGTNPPCVAKMPRWSKAMVDAIHQELQEMIRLGVVRRSRSPWSSKPVLIKKKDGTIRFCVDYRPLNKITRKDKYPLPNIDVIIDKAGNKKFFSHLDMLKGYWQFWLTESAAAKTAFLTPEGLYEFCVMPFGLTNAPPQFQRVMDMVLDDLPRDKVSVFIDDIMIMTQEWKEHLHLLDRVLERLATYTMVIKFEKCDFGVPSTSMLGYRVDQDGIHTEKNKVDAVAKANLPTTVRELVSFINMAGWYRRFIPRYAMLTYPLRCVMRKAARKESARQAMKMTLTWDEESRQAFEAVKAALCTAPVLTAPDYDKTFFLAVDASKKGFGAVLSQLGPDDKEHPIGFYSRSTSDTESRYSAVDLEATACEWALTKTRMYHEGRPVVVLSDHQALKHLMTTDNSIKSRRLQQLYIKMQAYDTKWKYRPGAQQKVADHLSRYPQEAEPASDGPVATDVGRRSTLVGARKVEDDLDEEQRMFEEEEYVRLVEIFVAEATPDQNEVIAPLTLDRRPEARSNDDFDVLHWQRKDSQVSDIIGMLTSSDRFTSPILNKKDLNQFEMVNDILYHREEGETRLKRVIPQGLQRYLMELAHDVKTSAHAGQEATYAAVAEQGWWPAMRNDVMTYVRGCELCQSVIHGPRPEVAVMPHYVDKPMHEIAIDIVGPGPITTRGNRFILTMVDRITRWVEAAPMKTMTGDEIAYHLQREWCSRYGIPRRILSDQAKDLISGIMRRLMQLYRVSWKTSTPEHPQSNGLVERFNKTIQLTMTKLLIQEHTEWDEVIPYALQAYRGTYHETLRMSPYKATFGGDMTTILDLKVPDLPPHVTDQHDFGSLSTTERVAYIRDLQEELVQYLNEQQHLKETGAAEATTQLMERYEVGGKVWLYHPSRNQAKFTPSWTGPHEILELKPPVNIVIREKMKNREEVHTVHASRTKPFVGRSPKPKEFPEVLLWDESVDAEPWDATREESRQQAERTMGDVREEVPVEAGDAAAVPDEEFIAGQRFEEVEAIVGHKWAVDNTVAEVSKGNKRPTRPRLWYHLKYKGFATNPKDWYRAEAIGRGCRELIRDYKSKYEGTRLPDQGGDTTEV